MNSKHINSVITKKFNSFLESVECPVLKKALKENSIITGGAIVSLLNSETPKDYDVYFTNKETVLLVANYFSRRFNENNNTKIVQVLEEYDRVKCFIQSKGEAGEIQEIDEDLQHDLENDETPQLEKIDYEPVYITSNAITLSGGIQLIIRFYGEAEQIHENYDFVHCTNYWTSKNNKVVLNALALESIINKELIYIGSKYPLASMFRIRKFLKRGYSINAGQMLKIGIQISALDLSDVKVIEDQLIGVDTAYFNAIINSVRIAKEEGRLDTQLQTHAYIFAMVDKLF